MFLPSPHFLYFSFHCSHAHPPLPSFPTRRSSDLAPSSGWSTIELPRCGVSCSTLEWTSELSIFMVYQSCSESQYARSEEHTSELQSPCNLVCRLLLEKKKEEKVVCMTVNRSGNMT